MLELWDADSGNIMGSYPTLIDLVQAAYSWGQANPTLPADFLVVTKEEYSDRTIEVWEKATSGNHNDPYVNNPRRCLRHIDAQHEIGECDPSAPARGIFHGLLLGCSFFIVVGLIVLWVITK